MKHTLAIILLSILFGCQSEPSASTAIQGWQASLSDSLTEFAPGIVSTGQEFAISFHLEMREVYFTRLDTGRRFYIYRSLFAESQWQEPQLASFSGRWRDADPFVSPDGERLYFMSYRPLDKADSVETENPKIWYVERLGDTWGEPIALGPSVNVVDSGSGFPSVDKDYNLYFPSQRRNGQNDIYFSAYQDGVYQPAVLLAPSVNDSLASDSNPAINAAGDRLVFYSSREGGLGKVDLYSSHRLADGSWSKARNLGPTVNSEAVEYCPAFSPDERVLFFTRRGEEGRIYYRRTEGLFGKTEGI
ncbi:MAG: hypothetical protein AAFQ68_22350 [Bacteroidota bacterium]